MPDGPDEGGGYKKNYDKNYQSIRGKNNYLPKRIGMFVRDLIGCYMKIPENPISTPFCLCSLNSREMLFLTLGMIGKTTWLYYAHLSSKPFPIFYPVRFGWFSFLKTHDKNIFSLGL